MNVKTIALAYCIENNNVAEALEKQLSGVIDRIEHFYGNKNQPDTPLADQLRSYTGPVILIVSDNFLKTVSCMHRGLQMLQDKRNQILPVIIDGQAYDETANKMVKVITHFDRVSDIIQYINYWQDQYLDLRRQKRHLKDIDEDVFNEHLKVMRDISSEAGEFLRVLRSIPHLNFEQLEANDYEAFFRFVSAPAAWDQFKRLRVQERMRQPEPEMPAVAPVVEVAPEVLEVPTMPEERFDNQTPVEFTTPADHLAGEPAPALEENAVQLVEEAPPVEEMLNTPGEAHVEEPATISHEIGELDEEEDELDEEALIGQASPQELTPELNELINLSWKSADEGRTEEALHRMADAVASHPQVVDLRYHYALMLAHKTDNRSAAADQLRQLLNVDPDNDNAFFLLAELKEMDGSFDQALSLYEKLAEKNPAYPDIYFRLGALLANHVAGSQTQAAKAFKKALKANPGNSDACYQYAVLLAESLDKPKKAAKYFRKTLELTPQHPFAWYDLALLYHRQGKFQEAYDAYLQAAANNPELKTPENDQAFYYEAPAEIPMPVAAANINLEEHHVIDALKNTISRLEELLRIREEEAKQPEPEPEPPAPKPGQGKTVLVTGATSGIGKATAARFADEGFRVIITGRRYERLEATQKELQEAFGAEVEKLCFDVRNVQAVQAAIESLTGDWAHIDILVNNAGKAKGLSPIHEGSLDHWEEMIDTNIKGLLYLTRAVTPGMVTRGSGHVINVGSTAGKEVYPKGNVYCATKFAVDALTSAMRIDLHAHNVRVSQVSPAHVEETEFALVRFDGDAEKANIYSDFKPLSAADVADAIVYMATRPAYVNILDITLQGTQQASSTIIDRSGRGKYE